MTVKIVNGIEKMLLSDVVEICQENGWSIVDFSHSIRYCSCCGYYVSVDDYSGETIVPDGHGNEVTVFDICDSCSSEIRQNPFVDITWTDCDNVEICHTCENVEDECTCYDE